MLAPSETAMQPLATSVRASSPSSSFWVAQGSCDVARHPPRPLALVKGGALELVARIPRSGRGGCVLWSLTQSIFSCVDAVGVVDEAAGVRQGQHLAAQLH